MSFTLTHDHVQRLMAATAQADFGPLMAEVDPAVVWRMGAGNQPGEGRSGVYTLASFREKMAGTFPAMLKDGKLYVTPYHIDVAVNKAYVESRSEGDTVNGGQYLNKIMLILEFSAETGRIVGMTEYLDTAVAWGVKDAHGVP